MNSILNGGDLSDFAPNAVLIGDGEPADRVFIREQFLSICNLMRNGNPADEFLHVYRDPNGVPRFVKARFAKADRRITWAWDTITGRAKHKVAVGFYPWNHRGETCWAAMDFDAHDGNATRARSLAGAALQVLRRHPQLYLILGTSGSQGWHLFAFCEHFHPITDWVRLLKRTADSIGAEIKSGVCELFPNETRDGSRPHAIRAPGTWNPKTNELGAIIFTSIAHLLRTKGKKEVSSFLYHSNSQAKHGQLNDSKTPSFYCGGQQKWLDQFAVRQAGTRHMQLRDLVYCIFRQVGHQVARVFADAQYRAARVQPKATLAEHLEEFEKLWSWLTGQWWGDLSDAEQEIFSKLETETQRDLFRILKNFARCAEVKKQIDFPFPIQHVAGRLGVSFQHVSKLRQSFVSTSIIAETAPSMTNRSAARFRWCLP